MDSGLTLGSADTVLTLRALDFLSEGPADSRALVAYVCQLPNAPAHVAEHMAVALFAGHSRFARESDGRWRVNDAPAAGWAPVATDDLDGQTFAVVDVETTGARAYGGDRVTEVGVVLVKDGTVSTVFETLINPERPIPHGITSITNITQAMVARAPKFADVCDQLLGVLEGRVFVAHNARFDWRFLSMEVERVLGRPLVGPALCTVRMARRFLPRLRRRNLDAVCAYYDVENHARHRAGGDALATAKCFVRMLDAVRDRGCVTLDDLQARLVAGTGEARKRRKRRTAMPHGASNDDAA